jgi:hypothetical protein
MKRVLIALAVLALAVPAFAGMNPQIRAFITMDPASSAIEDAVAMPAASSVANFYLCFDCFGDGGGLTAVSLVLDVRAGGFVAGSADVSIFGPGAQTVIGGPDNLTNGWVIAVPQCEFPGPEGILCVALVPWFYTGPAGDIVILAHPFDGKATVDCNNDLDFFCVYHNGAFGQPIGTPGDEDCDCLPPNAVEDQTWGGIKALYR